MWWKSKDEKIRKRFLFWVKSLIPWDRLVKKAHRLTSQSGNSLILNLPKQNLKFPCSVLWTSLLFVLAAIHSDIWATSSLTKTKADSHSLWPGVVVCHPCWHTRLRPALKGGWIMNERSPEVFHLPNQCAWSCWLSFSLSKATASRASVPAMCSLQINRERAEMFVMTLD